MGQLHAMAGTQKQLRAGRLTISIISTVYVHMYEFLKQLQKLLYHGADAPFIIFIVLLNFLAQLQ